jgi:hypothetical protein
MLPLLDIVTNSELHRVCVFSVLRIIQLKNYHTDDLTCEYREGNRLELELIYLRIQTAAHCHWFSQFLN